MFHIHHPCMTFSSNLLSPRIKTHTGLQAQIGICKSSCALAAARLPPGARRPAAVIHVGVSCSPEPVAGSAYLPGIFLRDFSSCGSGCLLPVHLKEQPKVKTRTGWQEQPCTKSGRICGLVRRDLWQNPGESWSGSGY